MKPELEIQGLEPQTTFAEAGRLIIVHRVTNLLLHEPGVRDGSDIEALHDMRVYSRRLREALKIFAPCYRKKRFNAIQLRIRDITRALGEVRNLDVFLSYFENYGGGERVDESTASAIANLIEWGKKRRARLRSSMLAALDDLETETLQEDIQAMMQRLRMPPGDLCENCKALLPKPAQPATTEGPNCNTPLLEYAKVLVQQRIEDSAEIWRGIDSEIGGAPHESYHALRITFKKLRYALEALYAAFDRDKLDALYERVKNYQDILGDMNDANVFYNMCCDKLKASSKGNDFSKAIGYAEIAAHLEERRKSLVTDFHRTAAEYPITALMHDFEAALLPIETLTA
jgi:triphosphatase